MNTASFATRFACRRHYEVAWGTSKYAFIYMASGVLGNLTSALLMPYTLGVGASGAIMGVLGARVGEVRACEERSDELRRR